MRLRIELFVDDLDTSIRVYERALGFRTVRRGPDYASLELGGASIGLGPAAKLRLYHEVTVAAAEEQFFEYFNCHPNTGMLRTAG